jgi:CheY-like chemotaxis protein
VLLKNKRIFIIEDQTSYVTIASIYLRSAGAVVESDWRGFDIPQVLLKNLPLDLIILDFLLPYNLKAFNLFDQLKQHPALSQIPVLIVSAADPDEIIPLAKTKGFAGFISKPISPTIVKHVARVLEGHAVWKTDGWDYWHKR